MSTNSSLRVRRLVSLWAYPLRAISARLRSANSSMRRAAVLTRARKSVGRWSPSADICRTNRSGKIASVRPVPMNRWLRPFLRCRSTAVPVGELISNLRWPFCCDTPRPAAFRRIFGNGVRTTCCNRVACWKSRSFPTARGVLFGRTVPRASRTIAALTRFAVTTWCGSRGISSSGSRSCTYFVAAIERLCFARPPVLD